MKRLLGLVAGLLLMGSAQAQYNPTPDFWECANRVGGTFIHGRIPNACDVAAFGPDSFVRGNYGTAIFNDAAYNTSSSTHPSSVAERKRYMQEMYPIIRDATQRYFLSRKPAADARELQAFQRGVYALLRQESFWSHYRDAQTATGQPFLLKMVRGDNGHGHGMMQVDDRYHFLPLQQGKGWNMLPHFTYAADIYYAAWERAPTQCLGGATSGDDEYWRSRSRSAWSAYNGGPTRVCRWQNPADANAAKDVSYRDNYDLQRWLPDVTDLARPAGIDVACLMDNGPSCPQPVGEPVGPNLLMKLGNAACVLVDGKLECVDDVRDASCLAGRTSFDETRIAIIYPVQVGGLTRVDHNRHQLCRGTVAGLQSLGSPIATTVALELRSTLDGMVLGMLPAGGYQVLDFAVRGNSNPQRFYRVRGLVGGVMLDGWIDAGTAADTRVQSAAATAPGVIAYPGDWVSVVPNLNIRATPGGTLLTTIPAGTVVQVKEVFGTASANNLYYRLEYLHTDGKLRDGWVFAGNLYPSSTLANWVLPAAAPSAQKHAHCPGGTRYDVHLRTCLSSSSVYGPFTAAAVQACTASGAGAVCTAQRAAVVDGVAVAMPIWTRAVALNAIGNGDCPRGASRSNAHRFHCTETVTRDGVAQTEVYGPFSTTMVNACLAGNGNAAFCRTNRWPAAAFLAQQP